ncbi:MAG: SMP-30/gluconolactonase/LRE family protein [Phycisphaeraceae bacterium]|nr:SMP-30/gluconolactonase/LRE family protein [Phycisphaeraceae bacterium]
MTLAAPRRATMLRGALFAAVLVVWFIAACLPLLAVIFPAPEHIDAPGSLAAVSLADRALLVRTLAWHAVAAFAAALLGWPVAASLETRLRRGEGRQPLLMVTVAVTLLAPWVLFAAWWTVLAPGNLLHDWLASHGHGTSLRRATLLAGLIGWGWAPAALVIMVWRMADDGASRVLDRLDGVRGARRLTSALRRDAGALVAAVIIGMLAFGADTVCFDLAQEPSIGFELRSLEAQGAASAVIMKAAMPMMITSAVLVAAAMILMILMISVNAGLAVGRTRGASVWSTEVGCAPSSLRLAALLAFVPGVLVAMPLAVLAWRTLRDQRGLEFVVLHGQGAVNALLVVGSVALLGGLLAALHAELAIRGAPESGSFGRRSTLAAKLFMVMQFVVVGGWLLAATLPAALYAAAVRRAWMALPILHEPLETPVAMVVAEVGRFGVIAVLLGAWAGRTWRASRGEIDHLDGAARAIIVPLAGHRRSLLLAALAGSAALGALAASEIAVAAALEPPGFDWLASSLLNAIHYQRPASVSLAILVTVALALGAATVVVITGGQAISPRRLHRSRMAVLLLALLSGMASLNPGCARHEESELPELRASRVTGGPGIIDGTFERPRAIAVDPTDGALVVIDRTARVQRFVDGVFAGSFRMPEWALGQPVGVSIAPDGTMLIPDTHYHRIIRYDRSGREIERFGRYGFGNGEFIYPTDIAIAGDGLMYIGEYGSNDRIQVFTGDGTFVKAFGGPGDAPGRFERPQSLALSRDEAELFVVDSCNHRIQVFDRQSGELKRILGRLGRNPGEFAYPWAMALLPDDSLLVAEWGNDRVQRIDPLDGRSLGLFGGRGHASGRLIHPWAIAVDAESAHIVDMGNHRVITVPLSSLGIDLPSGTARR